MPKHINVALFVPHEGCPHKCAFCDQNSISGVRSRLTPDDVMNAADTAIMSGAGTKNAEIAFFGGSFTGLPRGYMTELLEVASDLCERGAFRGIRVSTRPDYIDGEILRLLKEYHVTAIELGAQSMDDRVLALSGRGHSSGDTVRAAGLIKSHGFELGLQMMTGLPGDGGAQTIETGRRLIELRPETVRIYPTLVLKNTQLERLYADGGYTPQTLDGAVSLCSRLLLMFHEAGINVIRLGLHSGGGVEDAYVAGPYHPAFRELCEGEIYYAKAADIIKSRGLSGRLRIEVKPSEISKMTGQGKRNIERLNALGARCAVSGNGRLSKYEVSINEVF